MPPSKPLGTTSTIAQTVVRVPLVCWAHCCSPPPPIRPGKGWESGDTDQCAHRPSPTGVARSVVEQTQSGTGKDQSNGVFTRCIRQVCTRSKTTPAQLTRCRFPTNAIGIALKGASGPKSVRPFLENRWPSYGTAAFSVRWSYPCPMVTVVLTTYVLQESVPLLASAQPKDRAYAPWAIFCITAIAPPHGSLCPPSAQQAKCISCLGVAQSVACADRISRPTS